MLRMAHKGFVHVLHNHNIASYLWDVSQKGRVNEDHQDLFAPRASGPDSAHVDVVEPLLVARQRNSCGD